MKKFRFKFEAVEKIRKSREETALRLLALAQKTLQEEKNKKDKILQQIEKSLIRREKLADFSSNCLPYQLEDEFISGSKQRAIQADHAIMRAQRSVEKALRSYLNTRKQTRMIELLREKDSQEYKKQKNTYEQKQASDIITMRSQLESVFTLNNNESESEGVA